MPGPFDNQIIDYDAAAYPFSRWVAQRIEQAGYDASDLHRLHETVPLERTSALQKRLIEETGGREFRELARAFTREIIGPLLGAELALQRFFNLRIMLPHRRDMIIAFHNGTWYGHGLGETTVWMPLVRVWGGNSLQVLDRDVSRRINAEAIAGRWSHDQMQQACLEHARPAELDVGQALLFQQENLHGNVLNDTSVTRVSFDLRIAVAGRPLHRKLIGGYFDLLDAPDPTPAAPRADGSICISYVNNNTRVTHGIPIHLQRLMLRDYCTRQGLVPTYEQLEVEVMPHLPTLRKIIETDRPPDLLLYSIYALPDEPADRAPLYEAALEHGVALHFANEDRRIGCAADRELVERMLCFAPIESPV